MRGTTRVLWIFRWSLLQLVGFGFLVAGTLMYNDLICRSAPPREQVLRPSTSRWLTRCNNRRLRLSASRCWTASAHRLQHNRATLLQRASGARTNEMEAGTRALAGGHTKKSYDKHAF
jgi:hypothetical protein